MRRFQLSGWIRRHAFYYLACARLCRIESTLLAYHRPDLARQRIIDARNYLAEAADRAAAAAHAGWGLP